MSNRGPLSTADAASTVDSNLSKFKLVGFFDERDLIIRHMHDVFATVRKHQVRACIMFGTLFPG